MFRQSTSQAPETIAGTQSTYATNALNQYTEISSAEPNQQTATPSNQLSAFQLSYNNDGNVTLIQTSTGTWNVEYNAENRPVRWTNAATGTVITMSFDSQGRRTEYKSVTNGAQNTWLRFLYDGYLCVQVLYSNEPYNVFKEFVWDPTEPVATRPLVFRYAPNSLNLFYAFDGNKNVSDVFYRMTSNGIGAHYDYAPFGATTRTHCDSSASFDIVALNPFRFSSEYYDSELDLVYYNYRHYSPSLGRFLSRDPIQEQGGLNLYAFVENSVSKFVDIRGHKASVIGICSDRVPIVGSHGIANAAEFEVLDFPLSIDAVGGGSFLLKISVSGAIPRMIIRYNKSVFASDSEFRESAVYKHEKQHFEIFKKEYNSFVEEINVYEGWHFNCCRKNFYQFYNNRKKLYEKQKELQNLKLEAKDYDGEALRQLCMKKVDDFLLEKGQFESAHDFKERVSEEFQKNYISDFSAEIRRLKSATEKAKSALEDCLK